jgi:hypothetical protein
MLPYGRIMPLTFLVLLRHSADALQASLNRTMSSNNATSLIPILDGTNYRQWAVVMKAFIMSTGLWAYTEGRIERESLPNKKEELAKLSDA